MSACKHLPPHHRRSSAPLSTIHSTPFRFHSARPDQERKKKKQERGEAFSPKHLLSLTTSPSQLTILAPAPPTLVPPGENRSK
jgi:hypothetical protein